MVLTFALGSTAVKHQHVVGKKTNWGPVVHGPQYDNSKYE